MKAPASRWWRRAAPRLLRAPLVLLTIVMAVMLSGALALWAASAVFERMLEAGAAPAAAGVTAGTTSTAPALISRGEAVAHLGNCAGCHTAAGGAPLAGGRALTTPFGTVYAGNLTPDVTTGLGAWSAQDLWVALRLGRSRDGRLLLPAFPYTHYTRVSRADSDALYAYLRSVPAVAAPPRPHALRFPYNTAAAVAVWRLLFFRPAAATPDGASAPTALARGAYLVQGLGHCGACHAPRNAWGASGDTLSGGLMPGQRWYAPSLLPGVPGQGSVADTVALLKTGGSPLGRVLGPMAAVVGSSLQHWSEADLHAVVLYLQSLPPEPAGRRRKDAGDDPAAAVARQRQQGSDLYREHCADCHGVQGQGVPGIYPALAGNGTVLQPLAHNLLQVITHGGFGPTTAGNPRPFGMPPRVYNDEEMAAVISHVRTAWGNDAAPVSALDVLRLRR